VYALRLKLAFSRMMINLGLIFKGGLCFGVSE
jgi:hypothetical protein